MVFLAAAGVGVPLLQRLKVNPVLGFMLAGIAVGPYGLGQFVGQYDWLRFVTIADPEEFEGLGEIGAGAQFLQRIRTESGEHEQTARFENAVHLAQAGQRIGQPVQHQIGPQ